MKKIFFALVALCATMSMGAQTIKIYKNGALYESLFNDKDNTFKVVFEETRVASITFNKTAISIYVGEYNTITATIAPESALNKAINWTSSNKDVATVDDEGKVKGVAKGTATITAAAEDGSGVSATCIVTVTDVPENSEIATIDGHEVHVKWVQLWKDGPKFAEYNVGVTDGNAESFDGYYTWGGTYKNGVGITWTDDHNTSNTGSENLSITDDTATKLWGENWRMPTKDELEGLLDETKCTFEWKENYNTGGNGFLFTGKGTYENNSIFIPAAGYCDNGNVSQQGECGYYWSSTPDGSNDAYHLAFESKVKFVNYYSRYCGFSVRAVLAK